ncbi:unnamed protein product, partial [Brassica rapa subsp. trilocularis]
DSNVWDIRKLREVIDDEDIPLILQIKTQRGKNDMLRSGFSRNGVYDSKSGYKLLESITELESAQPRPLPPLEKQLWRDLWKSKTSPKLRHFLWRVMSGALAVKQQLSARGIPVDPCCPLCRQGPESICHMLFHCPSAKEVWERSSIPLPPAGFSPTSVFLNLHYLLACSKKSSVDPKLRLAFPWILWHIWKNRNLFCFEQRSNSAEIILSRALEEASVWLQLNAYVPADPPAMELEVEDSNSWKKPPSTTVKCNVGSAWSASNSTSGAAWILRNSEGEAILHSRRSFVGVRSQLEADLIAHVWTSEALSDLKLNRVILETSSSQLPQFLALHAVPRTLHILWKRLRKALDHIKCRHFLVRKECNRVATTIATSALQSQWHQSYISAKGPRWLNACIRREASHAT